MCPHWDADGLAAAAIALRARGESADDAVLLERGQTPFGPDPPLPTGSVALLDWGIRPFARPGVVIDHHAPEAGLRADQLALSGYRAVPETSTAPLVRTLLPDAPAWLAAVGAFGDLGRAGFSLRECRGAPKAPVRRLTALVNAPRRVPDGPVREALALLVESESPVDALADPRAAVLDRCREEWRRDFVRVLKTPPAVEHAVALIEFESPYQVHPLVATAWSRRLAPRVVVAANSGYLPDRVNFALRGGQGDLRLFLRRAVPGLGGEFANGHDRATGGSLPPEEWARLKGALGLAA